MTVELWAEIRRLHAIEKLSQRAIARRLRCSRHTVKKALALEDPPTAGRASPGSKLDPHKPKIDSLIERYPSLSAVRVLEKIAREDGYSGGITLVRDYLRKIRPAGGGRVYQEVDYPPARAMQVDWGSCGTVAVGDAARRRLSVFVAVLCYSRLIYVEFTVSQKKEEFYTGIVNALHFFGGTPQRIIFDNLKAAVVAGHGRAAVLHPEFAALCGHFLMEPIACQRRDPESKGIVEGGVRYVKRNALEGRDDKLRCFEDYQRFAPHWRDEIANVRQHRTTGQRPIDRFEDERTLLRALPERPFDTDTVIVTSANSHARVRFDCNQYSVPPGHARQPVVLRADRNSVRVFHQDKQIARHLRSYDKGRRISLPEHRRAALARRKRFSKDQLQLEFDSLGVEAERFREGLSRRPCKPATHLRRLLELARLYGKTALLGAIARAVELETFDAAYVENLLMQSRRRQQLPSPVPLRPERIELVRDIYLEEPDPARYDALLGLDDSEDLAT